MINYVESTSILGLPDDNDTIYSFTEWSPSGGASGAVSVNDKTIQGTKWPAATVGNWVVAYEDDGADYAHHGGGLAMFNTLLKVADWRETTGTLQPWLHVCQLDGGWKSINLMGGNGSLRVSGPGSTGNLFPGNPGWWVPQDPGSVSTSEQGQTWPLRFANMNPNDPQAGARKKARNADLGLLKSYLTESASRNFYGRGHGDTRGSGTGPWSFLLLSQLDSPGAGIKKFSTGQRYRFAFFDGCETARHPDLFEAFGAAGVDGIGKSELDSGGPRRLSDLNVGGTPVPLTSYPKGDKGTRPGLFVGYRTLTIAAIWYDGQNFSNNPLTQCPAETYPALCNWHATTVANWQVGDDFVSAAKKAYNSTFGSPGSNAPRPDNTEKTLVPDPDNNGTRFNFNPNACLKIYGYGGLRIRDYNTPDADWPN